MTRNSELLNEVKYFNHEAVNLIHEIIGGSFVVTFKNVFYFIILNQMHEDNKNSNSFTISFQSQLDDDLSLYFSILTITRMFA